MSRATDRPAAVGAANTGPRVRLSRWRRLPVLLAPLALSGCQMALLAPAGPVALGDKTILVDSVIIMLAIIVPTMLAIFGFAWWFRASNTRAIHLPRWSYSGGIEMVVWSIPLLVIILLGGVAWIGSHQLDPRTPLASRLPPLQVQVVSLDWKWLFLYPAEGVASVNELVIPAGRPVHFSLTSASVMNAFFIPRLGSMIYVMYGMTSRLNLMADDPGLFMGLSSHYSGDGFSDMHFSVRAVPDEQFANWIKTARASGSTMDQSAYTALCQQTLHYAPTTFRLADPALFDRIVTRRLPSGPGPTEGRGGLGVSPRSNS